MTNSKNLEKRSVDEFRESGLLLLTNQFLHIFGWCLVVKMDKDNIIDFYPARCKYRGFKYKSTKTAYERITKYMKNNIDSIMDDIKL